MRQPEDQHYCHDVAEALRGAGEILVACARKYFVARDRMLPT